MQYTAYVISLHNTRKRSTLKMCQLQPPAQLSDATLPGLPSHPATNSWQIPHPIGPLEVSSSSSSS